MDMSKPLTPDLWADYSPSLRAILDEYRRAIIDLERVVGRITEDQYVKGSALADKDYPDYRSIMEHVIGCIHAYVDYIEDGLDGVDRGRRQRHCNYDTPRAAMQSAWDAFARTATFLGRIRRYTDEDMEKVEFKTRWKQHYDVEQMLEHAIVHILRHRRQIERWLDSGSA